MTGASGYVSGDPSNTPGATTRPPAGHEVAGGPMATAAAAKLVAASAPGRFVLGLGPIRMGIRLVTEGELA